MSQPRSIPLTVGWGVYCASSWTWCIGMFLPVILLYRYGWPGVLLFAIPNVLGCAGMGYVLRTRERSEAIVSRHEAAMIAFSVVTITFHLFFLTLIAATCLPQPSDLPWLPPLLTLVVLGIAGGLSGLTGRAWPIFGTLTWIGSVIAFGLVGFDHLARLPGAGQHHAVDLWWLAPSIIFGFLLCPYLDRTFHRALQSSNDRHSFGVFGVTFGLMLVFTCAYAAEFHLADGLVTGVVIGHLLGQSIFTISAHLREMREWVRTHPSARAGWVFLLPLLAIPLGLMAATPDGPVTAGTYLRFLVFYGLVFPAYVLLFIGPRRTLPIRRGTILMWLVLCAAAAPLYELGYLHQYPIVLAIPAILIVVWLLMKRRR